MAHVLVLQRDIHGDHLLSEGLLVSTHDDNGAVSPRIKTFNRRVGCAYGQTAALALMCVLRR
jgi:hypothetical protein